MPNPRDQVLANLAANQRSALKTENALAKQVIAAYDQARRDLMADFVERAAALGDNPTEAQIRALATDANLIRAIETRLAALGSEIEQIINTELAGLSQAAFAAAAAEIDILAQALGINLISFALDPLLELTIGPAIAQIPGLTAALQANLVSNLAQSLAAGERFSDIAGRVYGAQKSIFANGMTSAELMVRRAVVEANNASRLLYFKQAREQLPGLKKQAMAAISGRTTRTCLAVHGQIQELDDPFILTEEPRFARKQQSSPFHWNCRTAIAPYLGQFEEGSNLTTAAMRAQARQALNASPA